MTTKDNPVLILLDQLLERYHPAEIDWRAISVAVAWCEAPVRDPDA